MERTVGNRSDSSGAARGPDQGRGGAWSLKAALAVAAALALGFSFALFSNLFTYHDQEVFRADLLSGADNPLIAATQASQRDVFVVNGRKESLVWLRDKSLEVPFAAKRPQALLFRLRAYFQKSNYTRAGVELTVNGRTVHTYKPRWKGGFEDIELMVPGAALIKGPNRLGIRVLGAGARRVGVENLRVKNYAGVSKNFPTSVVLFDENYHGEGYSAYTRPLDYVFYPVAFFLVWLISANTAALGGLPLSVALRKAFYVYLPTVVVLAGVVLFSVASAYTVVCRRDTFLIFVFVPGGLYFVYHNLRSLARRLTRMPLPAAPRAPVEVRTKTRAPKLRLRTERLAAGARFLVRHIATAAIAFFILCLLSAGVLLIFEYRTPAERLADVAYFSLVVGVLTRIFDLRRGE
ncbi:MAG: hypothetical protein ACE5EI_00430 [Thermodesulfobacteriota bacterium]